jgi:phosphatidylserine/phosphatidylglycerophosphate/cardiolipin synthase-like enzyme
VIDNDVAFVSSANFTEAAQERNIEIGVSIQSRRIASELSRHFASLVANGLLKLLPGIGM